MPFNEGNMQQVFLMPEDATITSNQISSPSNGTLFRSNSCSPFYVEKEKKEHITIFNLSENTLGHENSQFTRVASSSHASCSHTTYPYAGFPYGESESVHEISPSYNGTHFDSRSSICSTFKPLNNDQYLPSYLSTVGPNMQNYTTPICYSAVPSREYTGMKLIKKESLPLDMTNLYNATRASSKVYIEKIGSSPSYFWNQYSGTNKTQAINKTDESNASVYEMYCSESTNAPVTDVCTEQNKVIHKVDKILIKNDGTSSKLSFPNTLPYYNEYKTPVIKVLTTSRSAYSSNPDMAMNEIARKQLVYNISNNDVKQRHSTQTGAYQSEHFSLAYDVPRSFNGSFKHGPIECLDNKPILNANPTVCIYNDIIKEEPYIEMENDEKTENLIGNTIYQGEVQIDKGSTVLLNGEVYDELAYNEIKPFSERVKCNNSSTSKYFYKIKNPIAKAKVKTNVCKTIDHGLSTLRKGISRFWRAKSEDLISRKSIQLTDNKKVHIIRVNGKLSHPEILNILKNCNVKSKNLNVDEFCDNLNTYQKLENASEDGQLIQTSSAANDNIDEYKGHDYQKLENASEDGQLIQTSSAANDNIDEYKGHDGINKVKNSCLNTDDSVHYLTENNSREGQKSVDNINSQNLNKYNISDAESKKNECNPKIRVLNKIVDVSSSSSNNDLTLTERISHIVSTVADDMEAHDLAKWNAKHIYKVYEEVDGFKETVPRHIVAACLYFGGVVSGQPILITEKARRLYDFKTFLTKVHRIISTTRPEIPVDLPPSTYSPLLIKLCEIEDEYMVMSIHQVLSYVDIIEFKSPGLSQQWAIAALLTAVKIAKKSEYQDFVNKLKIYFRTQTLVNSYQKILKKKMQS